MIDIFDPKVYNRPMTTSSKTQEVASVLVDGKQVSSWAEAYEVCNAWKKKGIIGNLVSIEFLDIDIERSYFVNTRMFYFLSMVDAPMIPWSVEQYDKLHAKVGAISSYS